MKVIRPGRKPEPPPVYRVECSWCGALLEYDERDIRVACNLDERVVCPECKGLVYHQAENKVVMRDGGQS